MEAPNCAEAICRYVASKPYWNGHEVRRNGPRVDCEREVDLTRNNRNTHGGHKRVVTWASLESGHREVAAAVRELAVRYGYEDAAAELIEQRPELSIRPNNKYLN